MNEGNTGGSDTSGRQDPLVGRRLASYEVLARVARGGMGVVYRARHVYIDKIVALKVLDPALAGRSDLIERFRTEAQSLARVEHDNVVKVIDILEDKGVHFIVMDFAEGTNLRNLVKEKGPLSGEELLSVARQTAEALYAAHREGILHRDIKPENLILNSRGRCKLADFGLAGDLRLIAEGHEGPLNFGTPAYSAPEVLRRMVPDKRSDVFSFGATLYYLATGEPPFGQTGAQAIMLRQKQGAELLDARRPDLPARFTQLVMDCIQYHPKDRPSSFLELLDRLPKRMVTRGVSPTATRPTEPTDVAQLDSGTHETPGGTGERPTLLIGAVALAALAVGIVLVLWLGSIFTGDDNPATRDNGAPSTGNRQVEVPRANRTGTVGKAEPDDGGSAFRPEEEAFHAAELDSRAALGNADYNGAWSAWASFLRAYPNSEYAVQALEKQDDVAKRVAQLRSQEYEKAKLASEEALKSRHTAEALAALDRFPAELLVSLSEGDDVDVARKLDTQRQVVLAAESDDLARVLQKADELRGDWQSDQDNAANLSDIRRMRNSGNLLKERALLESFLPGRTADTVDRLSKRLAALRKLLETVHQDATTRLDAWRAFHDGSLGEWSAAALEVVESLGGRLERRDFKHAFRALDKLQADLTARRSQAAAQAKSEELREHIAASDCVLSLLRRYREDLLLADRVTAALENNLRGARRANNELEFLVHAEMDADGNRSVRIDKYSGRVTSVGSSNFTIDHNGERVTISYEMLTATTVRRVVHEGESFDEQLCLVAWLVAIARFDDAESEFSRLERMNGVPDDVVARGRELAASKVPAPDAQRKLAYLAARGGLRRYDDLNAAFGAGTLQRRLAEAQAGISRGDAAAARAYLAAVSEVVDPELVHLASFERALAMVEPAVGDLRNWIVLEPLNAAAFAAVAEKLDGAGDSIEARQMAGRALVLDGSNELAWRVWSK
ncbi:MAG: protein kinase [Planctomycetes bacterium]|nr:protein kinase [Planctomycetota bacterium]MCB9935009.1 protein kinase [Planctomycetota bacterium]